MVRDLRHLLQPASREAAIIQSRKPILVPQRHRFRVFYHRHVFRCGLCGKAYATRELAWVCVAACAAVEMETIAVQENVSGESRVFSCPMCLKYFVNRQDAQICFERCRDEALAHFPAEAMRLAVVSVPGERPEALRGQELDGKRLEAVETGRNASQPSVPENGGSKAQVAVEENSLEALVPLPEGVSLGDLDFASDEGSGSLEALSTLGHVEARDADSGSETQSEMADVSLDGSLDFLPDGGAPAQDDRIKRKPGQKPFIRDGARYVCTACHSKYFTRQEAEQCFESHPLSALA